MVQKKWKWTSRPASTSPRILSILSYLPHFANHPLMDDVPYETYSDANTFGPPHPPCIQQAGCIEDVSDTNQPNINKQPEPQTNYELDEEWTFTSGRVTTIPYLHNCFSILVLLGKFYKYFTFSSNTNMFSKKLWKCLNSVGSAPLTLPTGKFFARLVLQIGTIGFIKKLWVSKLNYFSKELPTE